MSEHLTIEEQLKTETTTGYKRRKKEETKAAATNDVVKSWYVVSNGKILLKRKTANGNIYSSFIGNQTSDRGKDFLKKLKKEGVTIEAI